MHICKSFLFLTVALVTLAKDAVVSRGLYNGDDTTNPDARDHKVYLDPRNHPMAVASILMYAGAKVGYEPHSQIPSKSRHTFRAFRKKVAKFPGFLKGDSIHLIVNLEGGSLNEVEDKVREAYPFADGAYISSNLRYALPATNTNPNLRDFVFSLVVISKPYGSDDPDNTNTKMTVELVRLHLEIQTSDDDKVVRIPKQAAKLIVTQFEVKPHFLIRRAHHLAKKIPRKTLMDFVKYFWSPDLQNEDPACRCHLSTNINQTPL